MQVSFYDLNLINYGISINSLYELEPNLINIKCGFLHCCMDKLVPLGDSDSKWPKFSCDRLIEELKKYPVVYFSKKVCIRVKNKLYILIIINYCRERKTILL